jgi:hypothetical protein
LCCAHPTAAQLASGARRRPRHRSAVRPPKSVRAPSVLYAVAGHTTDARQVLREMCEFSQPGYTQAAAFAAVFTALGEIDAAVDCCSARDTAQHRGRAPERLASHRRPSPYETAHRRRPASGAGRGGRLSRRGDPARCGHTRAGACPYQKLHRRPQLIRR